MRDSAVQFEKKTLLAMLSVLTVGLTALSAVGGWAVLVPIIFVLGFFVAVPLVALFGDWLPVIEGGVDGLRVEQLDGFGDDTIADLRSRYVRGELTEAEFQRRLERLLETEDVEVSDSMERLLDRE